MVWKYSFGDELSIVSKQMNKPDDATVSDILQIMENLVEDGFGDYVVTCNMEYTLAKKGERPEVNHDKKTIDLGGYLD